MKKLFATFCLTFVFLFSFALPVAAEGDMHTGGKSCPPGTSCRPAPPTPVTTGDSDSATGFPNVLDYLRFIFQI